MDAVNTPTDVIAVPRAEQIAKLNDTLRKTQKGGTIVITQSVLRITGFNANVLLEELAKYDEFDQEHNDPYRERDFGCITLFGYELLWKIDYYDLERTYGSEDPADPEVTHRVLTIMLAIDW
jgi:Protein of unknown function (DUF3768)